MDGQETTAQSSETDLHRSQPKEHKPKEYMGKSTEYKPKEYKGKFIEYKPKEYKGKFIEYKPKEYKGKFVDFKPKEYKPTYFNEQRSTKDSKVQTYGKGHDHKEFVEYTLPNVDLFTREPYSKYIPTKERETKEETNKGKKMEKHGPSTGSKLENSSGTNFGNATGSIWRTLKLIYPPIDDWK